MRKLKPQAKLDIRCATPGASAVEPIFTYFAILNEFGAESHQATSYKAQHAKDSEFQQLAGGAEYMVRHRTAILKALERFEQPVSA